LDEPPGNTILISTFSGDNLIFVFSLLGIVVTLLIAALASASEAAFFSFDADDLERLRQHNDKRERNIASLLSKPQQLFGTIIIVNTLAKAGAIAGATLLMWTLTETQNPTSFIVALLIFSITFGLALFGEIIPKVYAKQNNLRIVKSFVQVWRVLIFVCKPISIPFLAWSNVIENQFKKKGYFTTVDEINQALDLAAGNDESSIDEKEILKGIVNFGTLTVKQIMRSRMDLHAADIDLSFAQLMDYVSKSGFSRIPVYRESLDRIEGVLYIKDLLPFMEQGNTFEWQRLLRPGFFVPETKKIDALLKDFQEKRVHIALVVDEYGGTSGLITMEDIIEEIIGDINDEFDEVGSNFQRIDDRTFVFEGKTSLNDFCKTIDVEGTLFDEVKGESESIGGLILELNKEFPKVGDHINYEQFTFTIEWVDRKSVKRIKVHINEQEQH
jgi:gliding motility-associated protein GldE